MSLSWIGTIDTGTATLMAAVTNEANNTVVIIDQANNVLKQYSLSTLTQVGCSITISAQAVAVCLINSASALVATTGSTWNVVELASTNFKLNITAGNGISNSTNRQTQLACDPVNQIVLAGSLTARTLQRYNAVTNVFSTINFPGSSSALIRCVTFIGNGRFIVALDDGGRLFEIDANCVIYKQYNFDRGTEISSIGAGGVNRTPDGLSYSEGFLFISELNGSFMVMDWTTGTIITEQINPSTSSGGMMLSNAASGRVIIGDSDSINVSHHQMIHEMPVYNYGFSDIDNPLYINNPGSIIAIGINSTTGVGWAAQETIDDIRTFTVSASSISYASRTFSSPGNVDFRLILLDTTDGPGRVKRLLDTYTTSPRTLNWLPAGRNIVEMIKIGDGANATWDASKYTS